MYFSKICETVVPGGPQHLLLGDVAVPVPVHGVEGPLRPRGRRLVQPGGGGGRGGGGGGVVVPLGGGGGGGPVVAEELLPADVAVVVLVRYLQIKRVQEQPLFFFFLTFFTPAKIRVRSACLLPNQQRTLKELPAELRC